MNFAAFFFGRLGDRYGYKVSEMQNQAHFPANLVHLGIRCMARHVYRQLVLRVMVIVALSRYHERLGLWDGNAAVHVTAESVVLPSPRACKRSRIVWCRLGRWNFHPDSARAIASCWLQEDSSVGTHRLQG